MDHQPMVAIIGQQKRISLDVQYQQEVDLNTLFKDVSEFVQTCMHPVQARQLIDRTVKVALTTRGVATVIFPEDMQEEDAQPSPLRMHGAVYTSIGWTKPRIIPPEAELRKAADILNEGAKVAMLVGQGAAHGQSEVVEVAELLGAGVAKILLGREVLSDDLPHVTGRSGCSAPPQATR
jgi:pyruvate dehydrogenase (quinone)